MNIDLGEVEFETSPIPSGVVRAAYEATIKRDGCIWRIHKNDADPYPSNPHAINIESGLKLDLSTGDLYFRGKCQKKIPYKSLLFIRTQAETKGIELPVLAA